MSRYIDLEAFDDWYDDGYDLYASYEALHSAPTIDIVFCKECKYYDKFPTWSACTYWSGDPYEQASVNDDNSCSGGEREGE